ncbi:MAG TPA: SRPBCC family protein [Acidimicrobiales bacterium]|nr:SRPBCC family protein [Acidimicrobiales bacterium]
MTARRASIRREIRIACPAAAVWEVVGDPARLAQWWPGVAGVEVADGVRTVTTSAGLAIAEEIVTLDPLQRRFQYRIRGGLVSEHLSTVDVIDLGESTSLAVYSVDAVPATMALVIGGAGWGALEELKRLLEQGPSSGREER